MLAFTRNTPAEECGILYDLFATPLEQETLLVDAFLSLTTR